MSATNRDPLTAKSRRANLTPARARVVIADFCLWLLVT